jgi:hypothetical protein
MKCSHSSLSQQAVSQPENTQAVMALLLMVLVCPSSPERSLNVSPTALNASLHAVHADALS